MKSPLKQIVKLGVLHLCLASTYTSFNTLVTYIHSQMGHKNLGPLILIFGAISNIFFNLLIPNIRVKIKKLLIIYGCCMTLNYLLNFYSYFIKQPLLITFVILTGTIISGFGVSIIGIVSGKYVSNLCKLHHKQKQEGKYYGIYGAITQSSFLVGSLISLATLNTFTNAQYYLCLAMIAIFSTFYCQFFIQNSQNQILKDSGRVELKDYQKKRSWLKCNKNCLFQTLKTYKRMISLFPIQLSYGLMSGFIVHCLSDLIFFPQPQNKRFYLTTSIVFIGIGAIFGVYLAGVLSDKLKLNYVGKISIVGFSLGAFTSMLSLDYKMIYLTFLTAFLWGFSILFMFNWFNIICSKIFNGSIESFAANRQMCTISFIIFQIYISFVQEKEMRKFMYYQLTTYIVIAFIGWFTMNQKMLNNKQNKKKKNSQIQLNQVQMEISDRNSHINSQAVPHDDQLHLNDLNLNQNDLNLNQNEVHLNQNQNNKEFQGYQMMSQQREDQKQFSRELQQINIQEQNIQSCTDVNEK